MQSIKFPPDPKQVSLAFDLLQEIIDNPPVTTIHDGLNEEDVCFYCSGSKMLGAWRHSPNCRIARAKVILESVK